MKAGHGGIFTVAVDGTIVAKKTFFGFPNEEEIVNAVAKAINPP
jgi:predicted Rdx family selenoprotein